MDKSSKISIKINGEEKQFQVESENIIKPKEDVKEFNWILPSLDERPNNVISFEKIASKKEQSNKIVNNETKQVSSRFLKSVIISIVSACVVGLILGFSILKIFSSSDHPKNTLPSYQSSNNIGHTNLVEIPSVNLKVAQAGIFKQKDSAEKRVNELSKNGLSSIVYKESKLYYVITGLESVKSTFFKDFMGGNGSGIYVKRTMLTGGQFNGKEANGIALKNQYEVFDDLIKCLNKENLKEKSLADKLQADKLILSQQKKKLSGQIKESNTKLLNAIDQFQLEEGHSFKDTYFATYPLLLEAFKLLKEQSSTLVK
ncbi:hypothetical protein J5Y03_01680 [Bacillus sp. RG28]|uniref:SPOR domain-containing protein n=1 Tax=Gottfriedia endophytica TaxID=2820819 RepID=A0A940NN75_9BACI|nr:hypothetical protein [Gottfriedia endophytica]MBP0723892.1 hypothetical protein [Gottfriedia endophytica]